MSSGFVTGADKESDTEGSLGGMAGLNSALPCNLCNESLSGMMAVVSVPVIEALASHELAQISSVSSQSSDSNAHVIINVEHLLLVRGEVVRGLLERNKDLNDITITPP